MKTKICTSIEQSKKLLELGLDASTADMHYFDGNMDLNFKQTVKEFYDTTEFEYIPSWSLSALLDLMPIQSDMVKTDSGYNFLCESYKESNADFYDNPLDAAYSMVVYLLEQGYIKTEKK